MAAGETASIAAIKTVSVAKQNASIAAKTELGTALVIHAASIPIGTEIPVKGGS